MIKNTNLNKLICITLAVIVALAGVYIGDIPETAAASFPSTTAKAKVTASAGAYMRKSTSTSSGKVKLLKKNTTVTVTKEVFTSKTSTSSKKRWYYVTYNGKKGYMRADTIGKFSYSAVNGKTTDALNYRSGAGTKMKKKGTFKKGATVAVVLPAAASGSKTLWYKVKKGSSYYYVSSAYVKAAATTTKANTTTAAAAKTPTTVTTAAANNDNADSGKLEFSVTGVTSPTKLGECLPFTLKGKVTATKNIEKAQFGVVSEAGEWVQSATKNVNSKTFDIASVDSSIKFGTLAPGKYTYRGDVYVDGECYTQVSKSFEITKVSGPQKITNTAIALAWPKGTSSSKYSYSGGAATSAFKTALNKVYPNRSSWGAAPKVGASCDVFVGTVCRYSGYDTAMPRGLGNNTAGQWAQLAKSDKWQRVSYSYKESDLRSGDIIIYERTSGSQHICIYVKINGKGYLAEAAIKSTYGHIGGLSTKIFKSSDKKRFYVYRATE